MFRSIKRLLVVGVVGSVVLIGIMYGAVHQRLAQCASIPWLADEMLPNANLAIPGDNPQLPQGWQAGAPGVKLGTFALDGDHRSLHLMGIANFVQTPPVAVHEQQPYCFTSSAITDTPHERGTSLRVVFRWLDALGNLVSEDTTDWQPVVLWTQDAPPEHWSRIHAAFAAPLGARTLQIRVHPASDDRVYLDGMHVQTTTARKLSLARTSDQPHPTRTTAREKQDAPVVIAPWPHGKRAALSFSFDWETVMAGLIHSRSVGDPYADSDPLQRGVRMRQGITTTLTMFRPYGVRATYYAAGYTLLLSNTTRTKFMGNPTYSWATTDNRWTSNHWQTTPWFSPDPYGTYQTHPAWYFGDLVPLLLHDQQDIQSHTFSHFYGGFVKAHDWRDDLHTWNQVAAQRAIAPARSLAFPWSSSGGMSYANWDVLEAAGITSVTRLSDQSQYNLFPIDAQGIVGEPRCIPLPGHERLLACPDFYLTPQSEARARMQIDRAVAVEGMIDLWAHTEEVVSDEQRATWQRIVDYAATHPDLWVAPMREIADWQNARANVSLTITPTEDPSLMSFVIANTGMQDIDGLTVRFASHVEQVKIDMDTTGGSHSGMPQDTQETMNTNDMPTHHDVSVTLPAGQRIEGQLWLKP